MRGRAPTGARPRATARVPGPTQPPTRSPDSGSRILAPMSAASREILWQPSAERIDRATIERYRAWLERTRGLTLPDYSSMHRLVGDQPRGRSGTRSSSTSASNSRPRRRRRSRATRCPARSGSTGRRSTMRSICFATATLTRSRSSTRRSSGSSAVGPGPSWSTRPPGSPQGCARWASKLGIASSAYMPNIPETVAALLACASASGRSGPRLRPSSAPGR